jgi:hypothetical protein
MTNYYFIFHENNIDIARRLWYHRICLKFPLSSPLSGRAQSERMAPTVMRAQNNRNNLNSSRRSGNSRTNSKGSKYPPLDFGFVSDFDLQVLDFLIRVFHSRDEG